MINDNNQKNKLNLHNRELFQIKNIDNNGEDIWYDEEIIISNEQRNFISAEDNTFNNKRNIFLKYQNKFDTIKENPINEDNFTPCNKDIFKSRMMSWKNMESNLSKDSSNNLKSVLDSNLKEDHYNVNINNCSTLKSGIIENGETSIEEKMDYLKKNNEEKESKIGELNKIIEDLRRENIKLKQERFNEFQTHFKNIKPNTWASPKTMKIESSKNVQKFDENEIEIFNLSIENLLDK